MHALQLHAAVTRAQSIQIMWWPTLARMLARPRRFRHPGASNLMVVDGGTGCLGCRGCRSSGTNSDDRPPPTEEKHNLPQNAEIEQSKEPVAADSWERYRKPRPVIFIRNDSQVTGPGSMEPVKEPTVIVGPDGIPYDPAKDPFYSNNFMMYKYPQYFTKYIGFERAVNVVKEDIALMKQGRIHKTREEIGCPNEVDFLVIGGGMIGAAVAYFLKEKAPFGYKVAVVERDPTYIRSSTALSTGGLRQQFSLEENILMSMFSAEFIRNARRNLSILDGEPPDIAFHPQGFLILANESQAEQLIENHRTQIELGALVELYTVDRLKEKFPMINTDGVVLGSYGVQNEGWFDPYALLVALKAKAMFYGTEFVHAEVVDFNLKNDFENNQTSCNYAVVRQPDGNVRHIQFAVGVIAAGYHSSDIARMLGYGTEVPDWRSVINFPIEPRKRYVYAFNSKNGPGINFPFLIDTSGAYCRREGLGGNFICSRSPSWSDDEEPEIDNLDVDYSYFQKRIEPELTRRVPSFEPVKLKGAWAGFYDYNRIDQNPILGQDPFFPNLFWACGFSGHGIQMAPAVGRAVMEILLYNQYRTIDLSRFGLTRLMDNRPLKEAYQY